MDSVTHSLDPATITPVEECTSILAVQKEGRRMTRHNVMMANTLVAKVNMCTIASKWNFTVTVTLQIVQHNQSWCMCVRICCTYMDTWYIPLKVRVTRIEWCSDLRPSISRSEKQEVVKVKGGSMVIVIVLHFYSHHRPPWAIGGTG